MPPKRTLLSILLFVVVLIVVVVFLSLLVFVLWFGLTNITGITSNISRTKTQNKCVIYAHRGTPKHPTKENTISAFKEAIIQGTDAIETDVFVTKDRYIVLSHDSTTICHDGIKRKIASVSRENIPNDTLEDALLNINLPFSVDIKSKHKDAVQLVIDTIYKCHAENRVILTSFSSKTLARIRSLKYRGKIGMSQKDVLKVIMLPKRYLNHYRGCVAQIPYTFFDMNLATKTIVDKLHSLGIEIHYWTVNDPLLASYLLDIGVDGIVTDKPEMIRRVISSKYTS